MGLFSRPKILEERNKRVAARDEAYAKAYVTHEKAKIKREAKEKAKYDVLTTREKFGVHGEKVNKVKTGAYKNLRPKVGYNTNALKRLRKLGR